MPVQANTSVVCFDHAEVIGAIHETVADPRLFCESVLTGQVYPSY